MDADPPPAPGRHRHRCAARVALAVGEVGRSAVEHRLSTAGNGESCDKPFEEYYDKELKKVLSLLLCFFMLFHHFPGFVV